MSIVIVGLARQGCALARYFSARGDRVIITDAQPASALQGEIDALAGLSIEYALGGHPLSLLDGCDLVCLSGGVPPETPFGQEARRRGITLSNDSRLTLQRAPAPMIGITGSSGKTTTTTLVGEMLKASGLTTWVGGNIGRPLIDRLDEIQAGDKMVLELSSFQLQLFAEPPPGSPYLGAILNITPNHLDRHPSMAHYTAAKANIVRFQSEADVAVLGVDDAITGSWWREGRVRIEAGEGQGAVDFPIQARRVGFSLVEAVPEGAFLQDEQLVWHWAGQEQSICHVADLKLRGRHNVANTLAACAISGAAGATAEAMRRVATTFAGVLHRLELVAEIDGVRWYNDSIATAPERMAAALNAFDEPLVLLAGGRDKHLPWAEAADLIRRKVRHLVLFGEAAGLIAGAIGKTGVGDLQVHRCGPLEEAVSAAARVAQAGDVVLLSPGGTSYDAYKDFEARGEHFRACVRALKKEMEA
ncbi:MAG: UDP-N-acetylmuramoyl-L-alanine--D-glutamate ligase [Anaerolineae bacterium]|nr:UDP-N-acetylmuramoyl-L-alanine--D-glutamate ligase [Anaerolineae bacterium]